MAGFLRYTEASGTLVCRGHSNLPVVAQAFNLRVDKPNSSTFVDAYGQQNHQVGAGAPLLGRAAPTAVLNPGDAFPNGSWSADILTVTAGDVKDYIINGRLALAGVNQTAENLVVKGDPSIPVTSANAGTCMIDTKDATNALVRWCTVRPSYQSNLINGLGRSNGTFEYLDVSGVTDSVSPALNGNNVNIIVRGCYLHHPAFFAPDPNHSATPPTTIDGRTIDPPWYGSATYPTGTGWNHADGCQIQAASMTGVNIYGNNILYLHDSDPTVSVQPLPTAAGLPAEKELSCFMLKGGTNIIIEDNWIDGGEYAINNSVSTVTGVIHRNRFGRNTGHKPLTNPTDAQYYSLMVAASGLDTGNGTSNRNVFEDTGAEVPRRAN